MTDTHTSAASSHFSLHPVLNVGLVAVLILATAAALIYWYIGQRRLLTPRALAAVAVIRLLMVGLILLCLLRPSMSWLRITHVAGSTWLLVDNSQSMSIKDGRHSRIMELQWACALGYLKPDIYHDSMYRAAVWASVLAQRLDTIRRELDSGAGRNGSSGTRLRRQMNWWVRNAGRLTRHLSRWTDAGTERTEFKAAIDIMRQAGRHLGARAGWHHAFANLDAALAGTQRASRKLNALAKARDDAFLARQSKNPAVILALNRVGAMSREQLAIAALLAEHRMEGKSLYKTLTAEHVHVVSFAAQAYSAGTAPASGLARLLRVTMNATGKATNISAGLLAAADHMNSPTSSRLLVVSDGRQNLGPDPGPIARLLLARGASTYTLCVGSGFSSPRVRIQAVNAPTWIFKHQKMHAVGLLSIRDLANHPVRVYLYRNGKRIATQTVLTTSAHCVRSVRFSDTLDTPGVYRYQLRIARIAGSLFHGRVQKSFRVTVRRDKLQVLLVDNQPRWEYQYLVNYFSRSGRVHLQAVLFHPVTIAGIAPPNPVRASPRNPLYTASQLPKGKKNWEQFNLIILGDIPPRALPPADQQSLAYAVETQGSSLIFIAGQNYMPQAWGGTGLAKLMPIRLAPAWAPSVMRTQERDGFTPLLTTEGVESDLSDLGIDRSRNTRYWRDMPRWYWHSAYTDARPNARVLWAIGSAAGGQTNSHVADRQRALLATMDVGAGHVMYLASDQTWRMRSVDGHNLENAFLSQLVRWAAGTQLPVGGKWVRFGTNRTRYHFGQTVHVRARILHTNLLPDAHLHFHVVAQLIHSHLDAEQVGQMQSSPMVATPGSPGFYSGVLTGLEPGSYSITLKGDAVGKKLADDPTAINRNEIIRIRAAKNLEMLDPSADPHAMEQLASAGGGVMVPGPAFSILAATMRPQKHTLRSVNTIGLLTNPHSGGTQAIQWLLMAAFALLATAEWVIRKRKGLI